jgi:hypothetical protein
MIYDSIYNESDNFVIDDMSNKLICTFTTPDELDSTLEMIQRDYTILYDKIFVLECKSMDEYVCTYNIDLNNLRSLPPNTVQVHRKKDTNTLYTINALNGIIRSLNEGVLDKNFKVNWSDYRNCMLLTSNNEPKRINTRLHKIIDLTVDSY